MASDSNDASRAGLDILTERASSLPDHGGLLSCESSRFSADFGPQPSGGLTELL